MAGVEINGISYSGSLKRQLHQIIKMMFLFRIFSLPVLGVHVDCHFDCCANSWLGVCHNQNHKKFA